jgi:hypothetical protein
MRGSVQVATMTWATTAPTQLPKASPNPVRMRKMPLYPRFRDAFAQAAGRLAELGSLGAIERLALDRPHA